MVVASDRAIVLRAAQVRQSERASHVGHAPGLAHGIVELRSERCEFPEALRPGDRVAVVAPSSPFPRDAILAGLAWVAQRYRVTLRADAFSRTGYLAGDDERRAGELARAMRDPDVRAILVARGGYGATRIVERLPWDDFARSPKWIAGFLRRDRAPREGDRARVWRACTGATSRARRGIAEARGDVDVRDGATERETRRGTDLRAIREGDAHGVLFGGNVALLCAMAAARTLVVPDGAIVLLEDVTERPYRVDRMLTSLLDGGHFARPRRSCFGDFSQCDPGPDGVTIDEVARGAHARRSVSRVYANAPFGHGSRNEAFTLGARATIRAARSGGAPRALGLPKSKTTFTAPCCRLSRAATNASR